LQSSLTAIFGTDGDYQRGNINCQSFGDRSCAQTEDETNETFDAYALPIGQSFGFGRTKFVPTEADGLIVFSEHCEYARDILLVAVHFFDYNDQQYFLVLLSFLDIRIKSAEVFRRIWVDRFHVFVTSTEEEFRRLVGDFETLKVRWRERTGR
jgi:hypothetical protein